ncbi:hypothetical protein Tco_0893814 [Tanacetum coccineum]|uniref:Uncharacterized protein n=1 Tax=Tanacetum coccineum TaxID=301880 RepID=A0ABQ5CCM3_9ASTR
MSFLLLNRLAILQKTAFDESIGSSRQSLRIDGISWVVVGLEKLIVTGRQITSSCLALYFAEFLVDGSHLLGNDNIKTEGFMSSVCYVEEIVIVAVVGCFTVVVGFIIVALDIGLCHKMLLLVLLVLSVFAMVRGCASRNRGMSHNDKDGDDDIEKFVFGWMISVEGVGGVSGTRRCLEALELKGGDGGACKVLGWLLGDVMVMQGRCLVA